MVRLEALLDGAGDLPDGGTRGCCACGEGNIVSRYRYMTSRSMNADSDSLLMTLAEFRFELRRFLHFSEGAAVAAGLHAKQHQLLLQVAGAPKGTAVTIAYAAERLGLKHNSAVELANRSENEGLLTRTADPTDGRKAILRLTLKGRLILDRLSDDHAQELNERAPRLMKALQQVKKHAQVETSAGAR